MLKRGDQGDAVLELQEALVARGFLTPEDMATGPGIYGPRTEASVKAYKTAIVDGVADDRTLKSLGFGISTPEISASSPIPIPTSNEIFNGVIDLFRHNNSPDFAQAKGDGIIGVIHKATEGVGYTDPTFLANREAARAAGLLWGAYHFGTGSDPVAQADWFLEQALDDGKTLLVLDFEENPSTNGTQMTLDAARAFVTRIQERTGRPPGFYSGRDIKEALGDNQDPVLSPCWFWLAQYGNQAVVPPNWPTWTMWQYTDGQLGPEPHSVAGIGPCDRNKFQGDEAALRSFWQTQACSL